MEVYATPFTVELKGPDDPVTLADRQANALICRELEASFPGEPIVAEESAPEAGELAAIVTRPRVFFVDPLDGTREFADRNDEFAVMIGLAAAGRAALGVLVLPTTGEALVGWSPDDAGEGGGAFLESAGGARRPLRVSGVSEPSGATAMVSRSHPHPATRALLDRLGVTRAVACGSVGVKVARVVSAAADLYVHTGVGAKRWDTCAPEAVLRGAGGRFSDVLGEPIDYASTDLVLRGGLVATNGALHDAVLAAARAALG